ncbi:enoyl-CoA hydratase-related protein [Marinobacteraceae bacterium S3BR75-40.1]
MTDTEDTVRLTLNDQGVARLTLNRPDKRNAFDAGIIATLTRHLEQIARDERVRVVVLDAEGRHFSAGADLGWMRETAQLDEADNKKDALRLAQLMHRLDTLPQPTVARVQGAAFGGALGLICCCDIAVATDNARFCLSEVRLGLSPAVISPYVIRAIGIRAARRYMLTAEVMDADNARRLQLVHEVQPEAQLDERIDQLVADLAAAGPQALHATKGLIARVDDAFPDDQLRNDTADLIARLRTAEEGQEGLTAFFEKRQPAWREEQS